MKIGIDNVYIERMKSLSSDFPKKILSEREYQDYQKSSNKEEFLAGRFASKEAYMKASGNLKAKFSSIEVIDDENGKPILYVDGVETGDISITHDVIATAVVIL